MKRESGENPEQTRCCKLHQKALCNKTQQIHYLPIGVWEGGTERSKSEDLPTQIMFNSSRGIELKQSKQDDKKNQNIANGNYFMGMCFSVS